MRALLLAAGLGTRLRPLTDSVPKCLVPIKGEPLLGIWLGQLRKAGIGPCLVNTHHLADQVRSFVSNGDYRRDVTLVHEAELLGTAGTLIANIDFFNGQDGLLIHADNYCRADLRQFVDAHQARPAGCLMTMMVFRSENPSSCGIVELDERGVVIDFHEKVTSPPGNLANGAVYILAPELLDALGIEMKHMTDFSTEVLPRLTGRIHTYETREVFCDIGTPETYAMVNVN